MTPCSIRRRGHRVGRTASRSSCSCSPGGRGRRAPCAAVGRLACRHHPRSALTEPVGADSAVARGRAAALVTGHDPEPAPHGMGSPQPRAVARPLRLVDPRPADGARAGDGWDAGDHAVLRPGLDEGRHRGAPTGRAWRPRRSARTSTTSPAGRDGAKRYPNVKHYMVWNEFKGFWDPANNRWDAEGYTELYNEIYVALKAVDKDPGRRALRLHRELAARRRRWPQLGGSRPRGRCHQRRARRRRLLARGREGRRLHHRRRWCRAARRHLPGPADRERREVRGHRRLAPRPNRSPHLVGRDPSGAVPPPPATARTSGPRSGRRRSCS